ncbi:hypothetical protein [Sphingobacterium luzhongxinii]|uniref:hypothetical protein n=1 Tax=Sphingobacterium luzhongxinii TaxID=2654181 RepID=UPI0013DC4E63|nr:hypothetical protein [Sphingobacterium sp. xlx-73]
MKLPVPVILLFFMISLVSCQKDGEEISVDEQEWNTDPTNRDSISFTLNDKTYSSNEMNGFGFSNKQINIKPYSSAIKNRETAYATGGYWWYGESDSLLFEQTFSFKLPEFSSISFGFSKKYEKNKLLQKTAVLAPKSNDSTFLVGPAQFATDNNLENTAEGVSLELYPLQTGKVLTTSIPAYSVLLRSKLDNQLQDDSYFHIIKIDTLQHDVLCIEARFELNVYNEKGASYRIKDGFIRFKTKGNYLK